MRIKIFEVEEWERTAFQDLADGHDVEMLADPFRPREAARHRDAEIISTFIYSKFDSESLAAMDKLKLIATRSTGYEHIPLNICADQGVTVCNVPSYGKNTVAEHVFGLLLAISHKLEQAIDRTRKGDFSLRGLQGFDLAGKTFAVIGTGDIGREAIRIANGFSMNVLAYDLKPDADFAREAGFEYVGFDDLLARADIITLHVPANPKTRHMIADDEFRKMKDGVVLINTARGDILDTRSLVRALAEGKVAAAGLDVLPEEPVIREEAELLRSIYEEHHDLNTLLADHVLVHMRNVLVTPHSAFNTKEAVQRILDTTAANIQAFIQGEPVNVVA